ncbi:MAG TPA: MFS transporter [Steroidobacteraceae bacterium]|nr:MFS transporter [Steroidobacteraceae bacterium]
MALSEPAAAVVLPAAAAAAGLALTPGTRALRIAQCRTLVLLFLGYASCYFCRSNLSVAAPLLADDLGRRGFSHADALDAIGWIASLGVFAYALGKWFLTGLGDYWGGKRNLLIATGGATLFTLLFASSTLLPVFALAWIGNRVSQSIGWSALIKVSSRWFSYARYGTIAAILTCSYLVGDAAARQSMSWLIERGVGWRGLFMFGAAVAGFMFLCNLLLLRESRAEEGHAEPAVNPRNVFAGSRDAPQTFLERVMPLLRSRAFLTVCLLGFATTMIRETFNTWTPVYLHDFSHFSVGRAAALSAIFPGVGALSVLLAGWLSDRLGPNARALLLIVGLSGAAAALLVLMGLRANTTGGVLPVTMIGVVAFCLLGPYSFLPGAFALDFGGKQGAAAASGLVDGTGYLGGALAGIGMARLFQGFGWEALFLTLALMSALAAVGAGYLYALHARHAAAAVVPAAGGGASR